jgi:CRP-like cAMP-binding protein
MDEKTYDRVATTIYEAPIGAYIGREGAEVLARFASDEVRLADKEFLFHQGDHARTFYLVVGGRLAFVREETANRPEVIMHVLEKGDLCGEASFIDGSEYTVSCCALGPATVLSFTVNDLSGLVERYPRLVYDFMRAVIVRAHSTSDSLSRQRQELADYIATGGKRS